MTTFSWIAIVVFAFLSGAALTLWLGVWAYKRHVTRIVTTIEEMGNRSLERIAEMRSTIQ